MKNGNKVGQVSKTGAVGVTNLVWRVKNLNPWSATYSVPFFEICLQRETQK